MRAFVSLLAAELSLVRLRLLLLGLSSTPLDGPMYCTGSRLRALVTAPLAFWCTASFRPFTPGSKYFTLGSGVTLESVRTLDVKVDHVGLRHMHSSSLKSKANRLFAQL